MPQSHYAQVLILLVCFLFFFTSGQLYFDGREVGGGGGGEGAEDFWDHIASRGNGGWISPNSSNSLPPSPWQKIMTDFPSLCSLFMKPSRIPT